MVGINFILLISQLFDAQYFEGKISIVFWILLAGLKNILDEDNESKRLELYDILNKIVFCN